MHQQKHELDQRLQIIFDEYQDSNSLTAEELYDCAHFSTAPGIEAITEKVKVIHAQLEKKRAQRSAQLEKLAQKQGWGR